VILIGQYDSSFVRRVGIALRLYGIPFEHRPWSVFGDAEKIRAFNPLTRVPTLVLDDGDVIVDSASILGHIDGLVPADRALHPRQEPDRRRAMRVTALAAGLADKAVALFYEKRLHETVSQTWVNRCERQIGDTLAWLEGDRAARSGPFWYGERIGHADIAVAASLRHMGESHPELAGLDGCPALAAHCERLEALPVFQEISQPFSPPA